MDSQVIGGLGIIATFVLALFGVNRKDIHGNSKKIEANSKCISDLDKKITVLMTIHKIKSPKLYQRALKENGFKEIG